MTVPEHKSVRWEGGLQVKRIEVDGFMGRVGTLKIDFNSDLNIITGRNGAGKTTLLKLLWYFMSGNIYLALNETRFSRFFIETSLYKCTVFRLSGNTCKVTLSIDDDETTFEDIRDDDGDSVVDAEDQANDVIMQLGSSIFFPTFRRIEGGFTLTSNRRPSRGLFNQARSKSDIEDNFTALARKLTNAKHQFVSALSTADVVGILLTKFADLSSEYNNLQQQMSEEVISTIKSHQYNSGIESSVGEERALLDQVRQRIEQMEDEREAVMRPIDAVRALVERLFHSNGILIGSRLRFGDAANAINSDALSAGEKQMLSFICYNALTSDAVIIIDEPELSLHVDWQRQLFSILAEQGTNNQFIIATHSPFIYSKYPDKEVLIDQDRGDEWIENQ
ncbi:ATP-binding protein [Sphingomonas sp. LB3N6]|uniref:AAA family ATPase n=1 Tax=Sphingomonas fucosidasi TaxID=3096164 RepID=UPI002FC6B1DF